MLGDNSHNKSLTVHTCIFTAISRCHSNSRWVKEGQISFSGSVIISFQGNTAVVFTMVVSKMTTGVKTGVDKLRHTKCHCDLPKL